MTNGSDNLLKIGDMISVGYRCTLLRRKWKMKEKRNGKGIYKVKIKFREEKHMQHTPNL